MCWWCCPTAVAHGCRHHGLISEHLLREHLPPPDAVAAQEARLASLGQLPRTPARLLTLFCGGVKPRTARPQSRGRNGRVKQLSLLDPPRLSADLISVTFGNRRFTLYTW